MMSQKHVLRGSGSGAFLQLQIGKHKRTYALAKKAHCQVEYKMEEAQATTTDSAHIP